jgi:predicted ATP-grasp superfamily ATP-dependent carboligase
MDALITTADAPGAVAGIRALGRDGLRVVAVGMRPAAPGRWSRYAAARGLTPDPVADPDGFTDAVAKLAERYGPLVIYPGQDEGLDALIARMGKLPDGATLPYSGPKSLASLRDKRALADLATTAGLHTPRNLASGPAAELAAGDLPDGAVVKPVHTGGALVDVRVAGSAEELAGLLAEVPGDEELILQERVAGKLMAMSVVVGRDGSLVRRFQQVATRTWPEDAGISSLAVSIEPDEELAEAARSLLATAGYWGLAQLQFLETDDGPRLIDVNTRFYGSMALSLAAGVNLPRAWHAVALGEPAGEPAAYEVGVTYRWVEADLIAALTGTTGRLFSRPARPRTGPMWAGDDPVASALFGTLAVTGPLSRRLRGGRRGG